MTDYNIWMVEAKQHRSIAKGNLKQFVKNILFVLNVTLDKLAT